MKLKETMKEKIYIPRVLCVIPARKGSKGIVDKNIKIIGGFPLFYYSILHAKKSNYVDRVIFSTDSKEYAEIALSYGAEVPFIRPAHLASDTSLDFDVFDHLLHYLKTNENYVPDIVLHLRPTSPIRDIKDIDTMISILAKDDSIDSVRSISVSKKSPYKMWFMDNNQIIKPIIKSDELYNYPRQLLPLTFVQNGVIDVIRTSTITEKKSISGTHIKGYVTEFDFDIDDYDDLAKVEKLIFEEIN
jgi:N-acylneuraminate cytidylyltransferase